jgi:hypothetical protein
MYGKNVETYVKRFSIEIKNAILKRGRKSLLQVQTVFISIISVSNVIPFDEHSIFTVNNSIQYYFL